MINLLLGALSLICIGFDGWLTRKRMLTFGPQVELNPVIRWFGPRFGGFYGVMSNFVALFLLFHFQWPRAIAFFAGAKSALCVLQLNSLVQSPQSSH